MNPTEAELRAATELDAWLSARLAGGSVAELPAELSLAAEIVGWAETNRPVSSFTQSLQVRLMAAAERRVESSRPPVAPRRGWFLPGRSRWGAVALAALLVVLGALLVVPGVRAELERWIQIGVVRIWRGPPATATVPPPGTTARPTPRAVPTLAGAPFGDLAGATTLADAILRASFPLRLPSYPPDLGAPDQVFLQELDGPAAVMVWQDSVTPGKPRMSLFALTSALVATKGAPPVLAEAEVHGQRAVWTSGPYAVEVRRRGQDDIEFRRLVDGHVLVWAEGAITYRLETDLSLAEAVKVAESLGAVGAGRAPDN